jgi:hypothetical protein
MPTFGFLGSGRTDGSSRVRLTDLYLGFDGAACRKRPSSTPGSPRYVGSGISQCLGEKTMGVELTGLPRGEFDVGRAHG